MAFQVFVSHSERESAWVERMRADLAGVGVEAYLFEHDPRPGEPLAKKIQDAIHRSQVVVVLLTESSAPSPYVQQEVGYALGQKRLVVPLVERGTPRDALAMLGGIEY